MQKKKISVTGWFCLWLFFFCFSSAPSLSAQESGDAPVVIPRERWNRFLTDWRTLRTGFDGLETQRMSLQEQYNLLLPKLGTLESSLNQSEAALKLLKEELLTSANRLNELNGSLKAQTGKTVSLEKRVKFYKAAFYVSLGVGIAGIGTGVLLYILK
jgi:hypothetical protein